MVLSYKNKISQKGYTLPVVALFVLVFLAAPVIFWTKHREQPSVQGAESAESKEGTYIQVTSEKGAWDLFEYLCKTREECTANVSSGKKWEAISGGTTSGSSVKINYSESWKDYQYLKVYVKPGWGTSSNAYSIRNDFDVKEAEIVTIDNTSVLLLPVGVVESGKYTFLLFTDSL